VNVVAFPGRFTLGARENLDGLVAQARSLRVFGPSVDFDAPVWDITHCFDRKPGKASSSSVLYFTARQEKPSRKVEGREELPQRFAQFVKTIIVKRHFASRTSFGVHQRTLMVARVLCEALTRRGHDVADARPVDFSAVAATLRKIYSPNSAYSCGEELEAIGEFLDKHRLCKVAIGFSNPIGRPADAYSWRQIDDETKEARSKKLPDDMYVGAVVDASIAVRAGGTDADLARLSVLEILLCAPWRINELLGLRFDCARWEECPDGSVKFGLAYEGSKKYPDDVKRFPTRMKPVAERALDDLVRLTQPSRDVAIWMEKHPGRAWLPEPRRLRDRSTPMTTTEIAAMMGLSHRGAATQWMKSRGYEGRVVKHQCTYDQGQVEDAILSLVAETMENVPPGRKLSDYLFLFPHNFFHRSRASFVMAPSFLSQAQMRDFLVGDDAERLEDNTASGSIFKRLNILDSEGKPFRVPSHGPRHYLNNMANEGLVSDLDLARWSGRLNIAQNEAYDHTGGAPLGRVLQKVVGTEHFVGGMAATLRKIRPAERADFLKARFATAHTTDIGMCVSDWSLTPCPSHGACAAGCGDHLLVKGDEKHRRRTETLLAEHEAMLAQVKGGTAEGEAGAGPWAEHQEKMVAGLRKALAVHQDPAIADGTIVQS
jgi:hypothetical protein